jgi:hypothetical protein
MSPVLSSVFKLKFVSAYSLRSLRLCGECTEKQVNRGGAEDAETTQSQN